MKKRVYYKFWITSSRGTDSLSVKMYYGAPSKETIDWDCEEWASHFPCMLASDNLVHYGWERLKKLPKNRCDAINRFTVAHHNYERWNKKQQIAKGLLNHPPFNGQE